MGKSIRTHHRFVGLDHKTGGLTDHAAGGQDVARIDTHIKTEIVTARLHCHDHFFQRAIACTLAQPVDGALDLTCPADLHTGQGVGHRHAQVVVAMHRPDRFVGVGDALAQSADELTIKLGHRVTHRVGHVDGGGALGDHGLQDAAQEIHVTAVTIFRAELHIAHKVAGKAHRLLGLFKHLVGCHAQLLFHVQGRSGNEGVNASVVGPFEGFGGARDVAVIGS